MRNRFDEQLSILKTELIRMGALCEEAISLATKAIEHDGDTAKRAIAIEREIDRREREIESLCMRLLLLEHPVASDLRSVSSALKMISDMERIGDQAADIAEITPHLHGKNLPQITVLKEMARATIKMLTDSIDSFANNNLEMARAVFAQDDAVDDMFMKVKTSLTDHIRIGEEEAKVALDLLMIAKYFERIGDHAVNVAEWVEYSIIGEHTNTDNDE